MEEEAAPSCDDIQVAFVEGQDPYVDTIDVEIKLVECMTTIDMASKLEFGLAVETISTFHHGEVVSQSRMLRKLLTAIKLSQCKTETIIRSPYLLKISKLT